MNPKMVPPIEVFKDERAKNYDVFIETWVMNYHFILGLIGDILASPRGEKCPNVLVVGSGTGNEVLTLAEKGPEMEVVGIDPSPEMIAHARSKVAGKANVRLVEGVVSDLAETAEYFAATLVLVLHFMPDNGAKLRLLRDIAMRLKPGAPFILVGMFGSQAELSQNLEVMRTSLPMQLKDEEIEARFDRIRKVLHCIPEARLVELLEEAGFEKPLRFYQGTIYGGWLTRRKG